MSWCDLSRPAKLCICIQSCKTRESKGHSLRFIQLVRVMCIRVYNTVYCNLNFSVQTYTQQYGCIQSTLFPPNWWKHFNSKICWIRKWVNVHIVRLLNVLIKINSKPELYRPLCQFTKIPVAWISTLCLLKQPSRYYVI